MSASHHHELSAELVARERGTQILGRLYHSQTKKKQPWSGNCVRCFIHTVERILVLRDLLL